VSTQGTMLTDKSGCLTPPRTPGIEKSIDNIPWVPAGFFLLNRRLLN